MKRTLGASIVLGLFQGVIQHAYAASVGGGSAGGGGTLCPQGYANLCGIDLTGNFVGNVISLIILITILGTLIFLIWGGIRWISSGGDKGKIDQARSTILSALIGLIIALMAFFIVNIVFHILGGGSVGALPIHPLTP